MQIVRALCVSWIVLAGIGNAWADEPSAPPSATSVGHSITIATNIPFLWPHAYSIAGSVSVNLSARHAIRANVASWQYDNFFGLRSGNGRTTDVALSWVFYPRRLWDGFLVEVGAFHRSSDVTWKDDEDPNGSPTERRTSMYAGRAMIGWSWRINPYLFVATAVGLSNGWEVGRETERRADGSTARTTPIARDAGSLEGYLRFGGVIEL
jgi:hypothetical protein